MAISQSPLPSQPRAAAPRNSSSRSSSGCWPTRILATRLRQLEPFRAVDFGEGLQTAAARRPFDLEGIAGQAIDVEVTFQGEGLDLLAAALANFSQRVERARGGAAQFLGELAPRGRLGLFAGHRLTLGNRPGAQILGAPERAPGMNEKHDEPSLAALVEENSSALCGHRETRPWRTDNAAVDQRRLNWTTSSVTRPATR